MEATLHPLAGLWKPHQLSALYYGPNVVKDHLLECLPSKASKAFIITGKSLTTKTPLVRQVEEQLGPTHHAGTFSNIREHAPVVQLDEATDLVAKDSAIDTLISIGGGSPIDSAKAISYRQNEKTGKFLYHITIPTTLSAPETTNIAGYTQEDGEKTAIAHPKCGVNVIFYDSGFALYTPQHLWLSTGIRALDHSVEMLYHTTATEMPCKQMGLQAIGALFECLPKYRANPKDEDIITKLYLAAFASLGFLGLNLKGGLGLSHSMGYSMGSPYGIPHGVTSCISLGLVVKLKANTSKDDASQLARALPYIGARRTGDDVKDAVTFGDRILGLVTDLGLKTTLTEQGVGKDQVNIITKRATGGQTDGPLFDSVKSLVEGFY